MRKYITRFLIAMWFVMSFYGMANAEPITLFIASTLSVSAATAAAITNIVVGLAFNALSMLLMKKPRYDAGGIKLGATQTGENVAQGFILRPV